MLFVSFIGGYAGGILALNVVEFNLNSMLQQMAYQQKYSYIDDIELQ